MENTRDRIKNDEGGAVLIIFAMMIFMLVLFLVMTVDAGMLMVSRRNAQNVVDAASLAAAQELPDDPDQARIVANDYITRNGLDPADFTIAFSCTSTSTVSCDPANGKYDTIKLVTTQTAPAIFGPVLSVFGGNSCWESGCATTVHAAACRGSCGAGVAEVDVVLAIDHTGSMTATDLVNAKAGAREFMEQFDYTVHRLGLAVTPPVDPTNHCDTINTWADPKVWLPVQLNANYQGAPHVLNPFSPMVSTTNCLDIPQSSVELPGPHTNLGDPLKAALAEIQANGRPGVKKGIVLETDGAANIMDAAGAAAVGATGPCDYAAKIANQIKALGIELYTIAYGADDRCTRDQIGSHFYNMTANQFLSEIATDSAHAYVEPKTGDLDLLFQAVGQQLAGGSKLVE